MLFRSVLSLRVLVKFGILHAEKALGFVVVDTINRKHKLLEEIDTWGHVHRSSHIFHLLNQGSVDSFVLSVGHLVWFGHDGRVQEAFVYSVLLIIDFGQKGFVLKRNNIIVLISNLPNNWTEGFAVERVHKAENRINNNKSLLIFSLIELQG